MVAEHHVLDAHECSIIIELLSKVKDNREIFDTYPELNGESYTSHSKLNSILDFIDEQLKIRLKDRLQKITDDYVKDYGIRSCVISNSWVSYQYKNSILNEHTHPLSSISAALYLKADEHSSKLFFQNPNPFVKFTKSNSQNPTQYTYGHVWFQPKNGSMILFPSWLVHGSGGEKNLSDERIVLSFNTI